MNVTTKLALLMIGSNGWTLVTRRVYRIYAPGHWPGSVFLCHLTRRSKGHHLLLAGDVDHLGVVENTADFGSPGQGLVPAGRDEGHLLLLEHLGVVEHPVDVEG